MLDKLAKGDEVLTNGGIAGTVTDIGENFITVEIADNVRVRVQKGAIANVLPKGTLEVRLIRRHDYFRCSWRPGGSPRGPTMLELRALEIRRHPDRPAAERAVRAAQHLSAGSRRCRSPPTAAAKVDAALRKRASKPR